MRKLYIPLLLTCMVVSCTDIFVENISKEKVSLIYPDDNLQLPNAKVTFRWHPMDGAVQYHFLLIRADVVEIDTLIDQTSLTLDALVESNEWCVSAVNSGYRSLDSCRSFVVLP
jgi:hypothetical protein